MVITATILDKKSGVVAKFLWHFKYYVIHVTLDRKDFHRIAGDGEKL